MYVYDVQLAEEHRSTVHAGDRALVEENWPLLNRRKQGRILHRILPHSAFTTFSAVWRGDPSSMEASSGARGFTVFRKVSSQGQRPKGHPGTQTQATASLPLCPKDRPSLRCGCVGLACAPPMSQAPGVTQGPAYRLVVRLGQVGAHLLPNDGNRPPVIPTTQNCWALESGKALESPLTLPSH